MPSRILIVEDETAIADTLVYAVSTDGFLPVWCATGAAALAEIDRAAPDLIVLDVGLPDINGFELFRLIAARCPAPVIFLTARSAEVDRIVGLELGADDYISKPFSPRELTARIRAVLRRARNGTPPLSTPAAPPFEVDEEKLRIRYFGLALNLTRYEFRLLRLLVQRPGRVYSRDELLGRAWDEPEASYDRTVDAHIKTLRAKLKAIRPDIEAIETHRGSGYALKEHW
ncbi:two-component system, OmpR family, catabolic regulation response regulator CreB [Methylomagnum ishizawai]|uniref:Two-component system, OmpR family, catabolic regulation response regulator CreB n=1 Tax=Methylomagnum ishizawai TaxID=1760988 RepID=A0A1Y6DAT1_9GAMM|nr:two-component system response regulator CreB [Methylomagnum ishizawai]SMF97422.1 two-component system, OmpR family, catabolic regulation response regulator CreB [Methylomagnum ishizawai]